MKVLEVYGDDDYAVIELEQHSTYGKMKHSELWETANKHNDKIVEFEDGCYFEALNFEGVILTKEFIDFLNDKKDYDSTKHSDWFVVE